MKYLPVGDTRHAILHAPLVVVCDIETTGFSGLYDDITEIGAIVLDVVHGCIATNEDGKPRVFDRFLKLNHRKKIPPEVSEVTQITDQMLEEKGGMRNDVLAAFYQFIGDLPIVFHNAGFDWDRFLAPGLTSIGRKHNPVIIDTLAMSKYLHPKDEKHGLEAVCEHYGVSMVGHHRAWVDCKYTGSIYLKMRKELAAMTADEEMDLMVRSDPKPVQVVDKFNICGIRPWKKSSYRRIYVATNVGTVYLDCKTGIWNVQNVKEGHTFDIRVFSIQVLNKVGMTQEEFIQQYQP